MSLIYSPPWEYVLAVKIALAIWLFMLSQVLITILRLVDKYASESSYIYETKKPSGQPIEMLYPCNKRRLEAQDPEAIQEAP